MFPLDFAGFDHVLGQYLQGGLLAQTKPQGLHPAEQIALRAMHLPEQTHQPLYVIAPVRPVLLLPDVGIFSAFDAVIMLGISRKGYIFSAFIALNTGAIRRTRPFDGCRRCRSSWGQIVMLRVSTVHGITVYSVVSQWVQGLITSNPRSAKSRLLRVTILKPCCAAVAPKRLSMAGNGRLAAATNLPQRFAT